MQLGHALVVEWYFAAYKNVEHDAKTPHVNFRPSVLLRLQKLWCSKVQTATECLQMVSRAEQVRQSKVDDFDIASLADEDVFNLQVSVHNAVAVAIIQSTGDLSAKLPRLLLLEPTMTDDVVEHLASINILEKHVPVVVCPDNIAHAANIRMIGQRNNRRLSCRADFLAVFCSFALCRRAVLSIIRPSGYDLHSDLFSSLFIPRKLHFSHTASADSFAKLPMSGLSVESCPPPEILAGR